MRSFLRVVGWASLVLTTSACTHTFGPVVRDIRADGPGRLIVELCNVEVGYRASSLEMVDCSTKVVDASPPAGGR